MDRRGVPLKLQSATCTEWEFMKLRTIAATLTFGLLATAGAEAKLAKQGDSSTTFTAVGPAGFRIVGKTSDLQIGDDGQHVTITVPLSNLTTGISLRDSHMRDKYLQVGTYPNAQLAVDRSTLKIPDRGAMEATANGTMTIHGKSKSVPFHYQATREGGNIRVSADTQVNMKDYGIDVPSYLGITVKPDVALSVTFSTTDS